MRKLSVNLINGKQQKCCCTIMTPDGLTIDQAFYYAKNHMDDIPILDPLFVGCPLHLDEDNFIFVDE